MATKVNLPADVVRRALKLTEASTVRASKAATNPGIKMLLAKDADELAAAIASLTEIK